MTEPTQISAHAILRAAAETYGLPVATCPIHACRRARACRSFSTAYDPLCLSGLANSDTFRHVLRVAYAMMREDYSTTPATEPDDREAEEIAIAICKRAAKDCSQAAETFAAILRSYRTPPLSQSEFDAFRAEVAAEYRASRRSLEAAGG